MSIVSFTEYIPIARFDGIPWDRVTIEESADVGGASDGNWVQIDTILFADPDSDPKEPKSRSFTTDEATLDIGWYRVTFLDAQGNQLPTEPIRHPEVPIKPWAPSIKDVADLIQSRTRDDFGNVRGTFTNATTPTDSQVFETIQKAVTDIVDRVGDNVPEALWDNVARIVAIRAAMRVELAYFSDQVNTGRSTYPQLKELLKEALDDFAVASGTLDENGDVSSTAAGTTARYSFPESPPLGLNTLM